jgi:TRAP-type mannitol/chloroaromatic compound transport system permease small subunit
MSRMQRFLLLIDGISTFAGKLFAWCVVILTAVVTYEVVMRYVFRKPSGWAYDVSYMLYGALFLMAGAYALSRNAHVRADFIYRHLKPRTQASLDLVMYVVAFFPGVLALNYAGFNFARLAYMMNEHSAFSPNGPPVYPFKMLLPIAGFLLLLQGIAEVIRCIICIRTGQWPERLHDVEELEKQLIEQRSQS